MNIKALKTSYRLGLSLLAVAALPASAAVDWLPDDFPPLAAQGPTLCQRDYLTVEQARAAQQAMLEAFPGQLSWEAHAAELRLRIQDGLGLTPWPAKTPLNPIVRESRSYDGYTVENVAFESIPGYWVTGNLYRPTDLEPPYAAVLHTHGHSGGPNEKEGFTSHGRFKADVQKRAAALARMGAVSLTIDMFGYGDQRVQLGAEAHRTPIAQRVQVWNAMRALDFLESLPEVDPTRLGVTGHSGGGTQAFLLSALDSRIAVNVPVAMVSGSFFGGCPCESGLPIHRSADHFANNAMITAMTAPRPLLLVSDGGDWTHLTPELEYPFIREIYAYYGAADAVENVHLPDEGHNYGASKREAMYPFMAEHLGLDLSRIQGLGSEIDESVLGVEDPARMHVFDEAHPLPTSALPDPEAIDQRLRSLQTF